MLCETEQSADALLDIALHNALVHHLYQITGLHCQIRWEIKWTTESLGTTKDHFSWHAILNATTMNTAVVLVVPPCSVRCRESWWWTQLSTWNYVSEDTNPQRNISHNIFPQVLQFSIQTCYSRLQETGGLELEQLRSSDLSLQSSSPSQYHRDDIHRPLSQRNCPAVQFWCATRNNNQLHQEFFGT